MEKTHKLKIMPEYFEAIIKGSKYYEIRKDDRDFEEEDILILQEFEKGQYTGRFTKRRITHVLRNVKEYGLEDGYCILSIDEELKEMPLICLRCRKYIPLTMKTFREIGYTKYSYCNECLHEGMRLLRNKDQAEERKKIFYVIDTPMGKVQEHKGRPMAFAKKENAEKELQAAEETMKRNGMAGWCGYMFIRPETLERSQKNKNEYSWMDEEE